MICTPKFNLFSPSFFKTVFSDPDFKRQGMDFILMAPAQHVLRYSLTLNGIKGKIPESHRHFKIVEIALSFATALGKSCDEARTEEENYVNLFSIRSDEVENCPVKIVDI